MTSSRVSNHQFLSNSSGEVRNGARRIRTNNKAREREIRLKRRFQTADWKPRRLRDGRFFPRVSTWNRVDLDQTALEDSIPQATQPHSSPQGGFSVVLV